MKMSKFKYNLPKEKIAQFPPKKRGVAKLLIINRKNGKILHKKYKHIVDYIQKGDVVVLNETKVEKRRTYFQTDKGRKIEVLFLNYTEDGNWYCLLGGGKYVKKGEILKNGQFSIEILDRKDEKFIIKPLNTKAKTIFKDIGHTPIPPYMNREDNMEDYIRYNTVFARLEGSVAAPTASLNLTEELLSDIQKKGAKTALVDLEIGWGTFSPIREERIENYKIHSEKISVSPKIVELVNNAKKNKNSIWAFGTTVARTLESISDDKGYIREYNGYTDLFIYPGYKWKCVDHLITNFHMPDSSLILLVSSFGGLDIIKRGYNEALKKNYKFLSYGDSMLII